MAVVLVTGASTGLGRATAAELVEAGHDVVLHARNAERLHGDPLAGRARGVLLADLGDRQQVHRMAEQADGFGRFDAIIHNAGVIDGPDVFAVNVVAPYLLTAVMTPPLRSIVLSSSMHATGSADLRGVDLVHPGGGPQRYDDSKLFITALAMALARLRPDAMSHAVDSGWVPTRMGGASASDDLTEGHRTQVWLATAGRADIQPGNGGYWYHRRVRRPHPAALDPEFQDRLLAMLVEGTGVALPPVAGL